MSQSWRHRAGLHDGHRQAPLHDRLDSSEALRDRKEDIEPNLDFELRRFAERERQNVTFNKEVRALYLAFAVTPDAAWHANFRDLSASITRMATLAPQGRINEATVRDEIARLSEHWRSSAEALGSEGQLHDTLGVTGSRRSIFCVSLLRAILLLLRAAHIVPVALSLRVACRQASASMCHQGLQGGRLDRDLSDERTVMGEDHEIGR
ncbi:hypothetical protein [Bosea sp. (in: a-proteobacteria)]